jgi:hypothetical protein
MNSSVPTKSRITVQITIPGSPKRAIPVVGSAIALHSNVPLQASVRNNADRLVKSESPRPTGPGMIHKTEREASVSIRCFGSN